MTFASFGNCVADIATRKNVRIIVINTIICVHASDGHIRWSVAPVKRMLVVIVMFDWMIPLSVT